MAFFLQPNRLLLWGVVAFGVLAPLRASCDVVDLRFSTDGRYLSALDSNGEVVVFEARTRAVVLRLDTGGAARSLAWRPATASFAVAMDQGKGNDIWLASMDGDVQRLTRHPATDGSPQWSDAGKTLIFVSYRSGRAGIYGMRVTDDGTTEQEEEDTKPVYALAARPHMQWNPQAQPQGRAVAYLSNERGRPEVWLAAPGQEPSPIGNLGPYHRYRDALVAETVSGELAWEEEGRVLLYVERDYRVAKLHAVDPVTRLDTILLEGDSLLYPHMSLRERTLLVETSEGLVRRRVRSGNDLRTAMWGRSLTVDGLALSQPALAAGTGRWAAVVQGRGIALGAAASRTPKILYRDLGTHLFLAERLAAEGEKHAVQELYEQAGKHVTKTDAKAARLYHRAIYLRKARKPREALDTLDRLADQEPPIADPLAVLARQAALQLFELRDIEAARLLLRDLVAADDSTSTPASAHLALLETASPSVIKLFADAHTSLRRGDPGGSLKAMRRLARAAPQDDNVRQAILDLLDHPYDFESVEETPNPFDDGRHAETVVQVLETLNAASTGADDTLDQSLRRALLQAQVRSQQFDAARTTARSILEIDGPESLGLLDFLRHYIEADRADRATHDLLEEALLHDTMAPEIESRIAPSQRALLTLARVKLALLEGDLDEAQLLAASAREWLHGTEPADDPHPDANLAHRLALFEAKVHERRGNWKQAVAAYSEAEDALVENTPERIDLAISLGLARAEIEDTALADDSLLHGAPTDPRDLWQLQIIERGLGDPLLNTTGNPERLRIAVGNLESLLAGSRSSALDAYVLYHMGRSLARAGMEHCAIAHLDRALNALPSDPLRLGILRERAEIHCLVGNAWSQWQTLRAMAPLIESRAARDTLRFRMVAPMLEAGARTAAKNLLIRLRDDAALGSIRAAALEELEILGEIDNAREE